jgi:hypothetical protein
MSPQFPLKHQILLLSKSEITSDICVCHRLINRLLAISISGRGPCQFNGEVAHRPDSHYHGVVFEMHR